MTVTVNSAGERGLLGVAFDPNFATNQLRLRLLHDAPTPASTTASAASPPTGDVAVAGTRSRDPRPRDALSGATNHNGGAIHFGPDGKLYVAVGDNANGANAQTLANRLGKMLRHQRRRHDPDRQPVLQHGRPATNRAIWALGLRNPFTFAFQPGTGRMFINDVGQNTWEEINDGIAGANYGWPATEGADDRSALPRAALRLRPRHRRDVGCAITGGAFYNPATAQFPAATPATTSSPTSATAGSASSTPRPEHRRRLRHRDRQRPSTSRSRPTAASTTSPAARAAPSSASPSPPARRRRSRQQPASQTVAGGRHGDLHRRAPAARRRSRYQWQRNGVDIAGATSASYTLASVTPADNGAPLPRPRHEQRRHASPATRRR